MKIIKKEVIYKVKGNSISKAKIFTKYAYFICLPKELRVVFCDSYDKIPENVVTIKGDTSLLYLPKVIRLMYGIRNHQCITMRHESAHTISYLVERDLAYKEFAEMLPYTLSKDIQCPRCINTESVQACILKNGTYGIEIHSGKYTWIKITPTVKEQTKDLSEVMSLLGVNARLHTIYAKVDVKDESLAEFLKRRNFNEKFVSGRYGVKNKEIYILPKDSLDEFTNTKFNEAYEEKKRIVLSEQIVSDEDIKAALIQIINSQRAITKTLTSAFR